MAMIKRSIGKNHAELKYDIITNYEEYLNWQLGKMADLSYPLRAEPKRDRLILNTRSFKKVCQEITIRQLAKHEREIIKFINEDVSKVIEWQATDILDHILSLGDPSYHPKASNYDKIGDWIYKLGSAVGEAIANEIDDILTEGMY